MISKNPKFRKNKSQTVGGSLSVSALHYSNSVRRAGAPYGLLVESWVESIAEGGDKRVGLHFCPFLRALGQTITMLDHYVNYPEKTKIVTERQPYLRSRPLNSDMYDKEEDNKTPIVVMIVVG